MLRSEAGDDAARIAAVLKGVRAYQRAPRRTGRIDAPAIARAGRAALHDYGGEGRAVVVVPSLINSADILDLDADRSLLHWLAGQGVRPLLVDWGAPGADEAGLSIADHVTRYLQPLIAALDAPPILAGYCLGGTMALAAAAIAPAHALALLATPWRFTHYADDTRTKMLRLWDEARPAAESIGLMPMEVLQTAFWQIDAARTIDKFAAFGRACDDPAAVAKFVAVEDWANEGPPLTCAAATELFEAMLRDDVTSAGRWTVGGRVIDPAALGMPVLEIVSTTDRIVPAASTPGVGERIETGLGHVGMIVGGSARATIWEPLAAWLRGVG